MKEVPGEKCSPHFSERIPPSGIGRCWPFLANFRVIEFIFGLITCEKCVTAVTAKLQCGVPHHAQCLQGCMDALFFPSGRLQLQSVRERVVSNE